MCDLTGDPSDLVALPFVPNCQHIVVSRCRRRSVATTRYFDRHWRRMKLGPVQYGVLSGILAGVRRLSRATDRGRG